MKRIFSGIQPSGNLHLGNYLGAIQNWVKLQENHDSIFCIVDMHAITVPQDPKELRKKTLEVAKIYLAAGIDPEKSSIFIQSHIKEHAELTWILNTITKIPELEKMTQFKDKSEDKESVSMGLFDYPVLMAADILLYNTDVVPVGEDQKQHVELTRTLARRFNDRFGETFAIPEAQIYSGGGRIMGLDDPTKKMSKSALSEYNRINLLDEPEKARNKIMKAVTDSGKEIIYDNSKPALKNLLNIYSFLTDKTLKEIQDEYKGKGYGDFKKGLGEKITELLISFQNEYNSISDEKVLEILASGAEKVRPLAQEKIKQVKEKIGFVL